MVKRYYPKFYAQIENGVLTHLDREAFTNYLKTLNGLVKIEVKPHKKIRSLNQNAYYHGVVLQIISEDTGHTPEELHDVFRKMFLSHTTKKVFGLTLDHLATTTDLTTVEFMNYIDRITALVGEAGITIPPPSTQ